MFFQGMQYEARGAFFCLCVCVCFKIHQKKKCSPEARPWSWDCRADGFMSVKVLWAVTLIPRVCSSFKTQWSDPSPLQALLSWLRVMCNFLLWHYCHVGLGNKLHIQHESVPRWIPCFWEMPSQWKKKKRKLFSGQNKTAQPGQLDSDLYRSLKPQIKRFSSLHSSSFFLLHAIYLAFLLVKSIRKPLPKNHKRISIKITRITKCLKNVMLHKTVTRQKTHICAHDQN